MSAYTYAPTKGKLAGRRFEVNICHLLHIPNRIDYGSSSPDSASRALYSHDMSNYYVSLHVHNSVTITELPGAECGTKRRIMPNKFDSVHTFEKICKRFVRTQIQSDPNNKQASLASLLDSPSKTF
jgi:hypothetical protein